MNTPSVSFEIWKAHLLDDCERDDKLLAYKTLGEQCLRILWQSGTEPSVKGILDGGKRSEAK